MAHMRLAVLFKNLPNCRCLGILHSGTDPRNDYYLNLDIRVMGKSVLVGYIQIF
jgi:hypothetical protein